jgi:hypothetical protein
MTVLEAKTQAYWQASTDVVPPILDTGKVREAKDRLWRTYRCGPSYRLRFAAGRTLNLRHEHIELRPGPDGGEAA